MPGVLMKQSEQARGVPLAGLAVKVTNGYFLLGLSAVEADQQRNIQLLKEREWFDVPVVYNKRQARNSCDGKRRAGHARLRGSVSRLGAIVHAE